MTITAKRRLKDGERLRVPMLLRDAANQDPTALEQRVAELERALLEVVFESEAGEERVYNPRRQRIASPPGRAVEATEQDRLSVADRRQAIKQMYVDHEAAEQQRWINPGGSRDGNAPGDKTNEGMTTRAIPTLPAGRYPYEALREGSACTINGQPGRLERDGDWLACKPLDKTDAAFDAREQAYREVELRDQNAWRHGK
jgi:hypothetical protein